MTIPNSLRGAATAAVAALVAAIAVAVGLQFVHHSYRATTTIRVGTVADGGPGNSSFDLTYSDRLLNTYKHVVSSPPVLHELRDRLNETVGTNQQLKVSASIPANTELLALSVTAPTPQAAATAANTLASIMIDNIENWSLLANQDKTAVARVVDPATPPAGPAGPSSIVLIAGALLLGAGAGAALNRARGHFDHSLTTSDDFRAATGLPLLGHVPAHPLSGNGEADAVLLRAGLQLVGSAPARILVTGEMRCEVATVAAGLARAISRTGTRVLIVDACLDRPFVHELFDAPNLIGLSTVLKGNASIDDVLVAATSPGVVLLPAGPPTANSEELFASRNSQLIIAKLADQFEVVVLSVAGLLQAADATLIGLLADVGVLVGVRGQTSKEDAAAAAQQLQAMHLRLVALVTTVGASARTTNRFRTAGKVRPLAASHLSPPRLATAAGSGGAGSPTEGT